MKEPLLKINNLSIAFAQKKVVDNISFVLKHKEVLGLVGESGSGKSLTALSIINLLPISKTLKKEGNILYYANSSCKDLLLLPTNELNKIRGNEISMIFQDPLSSLNPSMKCGKQAVEAILEHKKSNLKTAKKHILELFEKVKINDPEKVFNSWPHQLSGGQRQRVMIAMALSTNPKILIADEPTTALDVTVQREIIGLIKDLIKEFNMSVIFISHDLALVKNIADRIIVMNGGLILENGNSNEVFFNPKHEYTKALIACRPTLHTTETRLPTIEGFINTTNHISQKVNTINLYDKETLSVQNLNVFYPIGKRSYKKNVEAWFKANDNISFSLYKGETLGLVGESGCGKSTLIRAILMLIKKTSGKIFFNDIDIEKLSLRELRKIRTKLQIVFQDPYSSLTPNLTVQSAILGPMNEHQIFSNKTQRIEYIVHLLEKTGLSADDLKKYPHQFSGGQRQRVVIARALALKPKIVFCDESVSSLDVSMQAQVLNLFNDLKDEFGLTYLFISHDLSVVNYMSDRIMVMNKGKIVEFGNKQDVLKFPKDDYTKTLLNSVYSV